MEGAPLPKRCQCQFKVSSFSLQEIRANRTLDECGADCDKNYPMSPILKRVIDANHQHHRKCANVLDADRAQKSFVDLPQATLDLSSGLCNGKPTQHNSTAIKSALELSTLV